MCPDWRHNWGIQKAQQIYEYSKKSTGTRIMYNAYF